MSGLVPWLWLAGGVQLAIVAANIVLPRHIPVRANLLRLDPIVRQIFLVHWFYVLYVVVAFAAVCFLFTDELAGGTPLGRFLTGVMALFWGSRVVLQFAYYDSELRRSKRLLDILYTLAVAYLAVVFGIAALGQSVG